jgi:NB-ARC domain/TIR domain/APAF-1 helical domain
VLFISYAHLDGADLAQRLQSDLEKSGRDVWLDRSRMAAGASWSAEIERAIDRCEIVVALLSAGSFVSDICRGELLRALRRAKRVIVLTLGENVDRPLFLETKLYISFAPSRGYTEAFTELVAEIVGGKTAQLATGYQETYVTAPRLPSTVILRPEELQSLREGVLRDKAQQTMSVASVVGMGGIGKTILAQMLCHDPVVQDAYPDGIIWVQLGQQVGDLVPKMREVGRALDDEPKHYDTVDGARNRLRTILRKKAVLIVLDDVWTLTVAEPFLADAPASCLLITTRMQDISLALRSRRVAIKVLSHAQSLEVLAQWTELPVRQLPLEAPEIVRECGRLPLALSMVGGVVHGGLLNGRADAWIAALHRLGSAQLDYIRFPLEHYLYPQLQRAIQVSVDTLEPRFRDRYLTMGVFPEDVHVPESTLCTLWGIDEYEMQSTVDSWLAASLATRDDHGRIALHDLQLDYVRKVTPVRLSKLHQEVVSRYSAQCEGVWSKGPNDGYFFERISWHLAGAEDWQELAKMLLDNAYIRAKLDALSYLELGQDFHWSASCLAALENATERSLFSEIQLMVLQLSGFVNRKPETATIEQWMEMGEGRCLFIQGLGGSGKSWLLRHLWVRSPANSILLSFNDDASNTIALVSKVGDQILSSALLYMFTNDLSEKYFDGVISELCSASIQSGNKFCIFVDGIDEMQSSGKISVQIFLRTVQKLDKISQFIFAGRHTRFLDDRFPKFIAETTVYLGGFPREEVLRIIDGTLRGQGHSVAPSNLEALASISQGNPLGLSLLIELLKQGHSSESLLERLPQSVDEKYIEDRLIGRLFSWVPKEVLQVLTSLLLRKKEVAWEELQRESSASDSILQILHSTALFEVVHSGGQLKIRARPDLLEMLRLYFKLNGEGERCD